METQNMALMRARAFAGGYEGVTHAGIALRALDSGRVLLAKRAFDETDDPEVAETWEFPGGGLRSGEEPYPGAVREMIEETGLALPADAAVESGWRSDNEVYQGFVVTTGTEFECEGWTPTTEVSDLGWFDRDAIMALDEVDALRPEVAAQTDWDLVFGVSRNEEDTSMSLTAPEPTEAEGVESVEPDLTLLDLAVGPIPVHGVVAPEDVPTGDGRGFNAGSMTARPYRLPFMWQKAQTSGHDNSVTVGSVDRLMRKDGLIHWQGSLMSSEDAGEFADLLAFFGRYGVSVDGDNGSLDSEKSAASGVTWFDAVRASGLTSVAIPAFSEAYVAFGPHPEMPEAESEEFSVLTASGDLVTFDRGPGWVTNPTETKRIHDYWTKKGEPGYAKIRWGTPGDFTRAKKLIGEKIGANSPEDLKYLNQIIAQWHHDALGYWPGDLGKPGNAPDTAENRRRAATHAASKGINLDEDGEGWEAVLTASAGRVLPPASYFEYVEGTEALVIEDADENGYHHTYGYAAEWGVCHVGIDGKCVEAPDDDGSFREFHLGRTRTATGVINTGVITYKVDHRDARTILSESAEQQHFDNIAHAWAAVRLGVDDHGIWFSGVVLPGISDDDRTLIEATGQVSGEWKYGALRALQAVNVPGYPVMRSSAAYDDEGNVVALAASAHNLSGCEPTPAERMAALRAACEEADAEVRFSTMKAQWASASGEAL